MGEANRPHKPGWEIDSRGDSPGQQAESMRPGESIVHIVSQGLLAGAATGLLIAIVSAVFATVIGSGVSIQPVFDKIVPLNVAGLLGVQPGAVAQAQVSPLRYLLQAVYFTGGGLLGALAVAAGRANLVKALRVDSMRARLSEPSVVSAGRWLVISLPFVLLAVVIWLGLSNVMLFGNNQGTVRLLFTLVTTAADSLPCA